MSLDDRTILNYIGSELQQSSGSNEDDSISSNRVAALGTYLGQPDGKEVKGRSSIVSTDVADAIEWIMPEVVKAFTQNNEVVTFDATSSGDEDQAEMESQYVYDILMKDNDGFIILHQFIKDALMQKNGFLKVYYSDDVKHTTESFTGLNEIEYNVILADPELELIEETVTEESDEQGAINIFDIKVRRTFDESKINVVSVPPEEFRVNKQHNSVSLAGARFTAHVYLKTAGDLVAEGYSKELVDSIQSSNAYEDDREYRFYMQDESVYPDRDNSLDPANRMIEIAECHMNMDIDEDGIAERVKIEVAGGDNPDVLLSIEELDENPFISATAILMSHKLFGLSIYDRLKQIQEQKTTLWRNIFDNMYLQNNQRTVVVENQVNLDDLMVSRPGGIIRAKRLDAVAPYVTPPLSGDSYKMMDYLDQIRAGRSGVTPEGPVTDSMIGDRVGSEGVQAMMSQKEELVGLMIRVIAETGIKPLCYMIRSQAVRHQDVLKEYAYRGNWVKVNPSHWRKRIHSTVRVGTGSGNRKATAQAITHIQGMQERLMAMPNNSLVRPEEIYSAANEFAKSMGLPGIGSYLLDPKSPEGINYKQQVDQSSSQQKQMEQQVEQANMKVVQTMAQAETVKANAATESVRLKAQVEQAKNQLSNYKVQAEAQLHAIKLELDTVRASAEFEHKTDELEFRYWDADERHEIEQDRVDIQRLQANNQNQQSDDND
jgi:hypothetical protein